jgi:hypothetical protein
MGISYVKENFLHKCLKLVKLDNISNNQIIGFEMVHMFRNRLYLLHGMIYLSQC